MAVDEGFDWYEGMPRPETRVWVMWASKYRVQGTIAIDHLGGAPPALVRLKMEGFMETSEPLHLICARGEMEIISAA
jgi:hypothetical protein